MILFLHFVPRNSVVVIYFLYQTQLAFSELMHLIWFIMIVISTSAPTGATAAVLLPVTALYGVISVSVSPWVYGTQRRRLHYG